MFAEVRNKILNVANFVNEIYHNIKPSYIVAIFIYKIRCNALANEVNSNKEKLYKHITTVCKRFELPLLTAIPRI